MGSQEYRKLRLCSPSPPIIKTFFFLITIKVSFGIYAFYIVTNSKLR